MKTLAAVSMAACIVLAAAIIGIHLNLTATLQQQSIIIEEQANQLQTYKNMTDKMTSQINQLQIKVTEYDTIIDYQTSRIANLTRDMEYFRLPD